VLIEYTGAIPASGFFMLPSTPTKVAAALFSCAMLLSACSSGGGGAPADDDNQGGTTGQTTGNSTAGATTGTSSGSTTGTSTATSNADSSTATRVMFNITVPAYQSNALQVRVQWGTQDINAGWVGDELWSASADLDTNTEHPLTVTFSDDNGGITLGQFAAVYKTGVNSFEDYTISASQFDTRAWDDDLDGTSNLDELIAGTYNPIRILLFSETNDFRHDSIPTALTALEELAASEGYVTVRANDSAGVFTNENLANFDAVAWVSTSGDVLDANEQAAFEQFIQAGGGYMGIHAASFTEYQWPWYGQLVGAYFESHPAIQSATQTVEDQSHQSTAHLGTSWTRTDEWYDYSSNPRALVNVLLSLNEGSYTGGAMGQDHPSAWYHEFDGGRAWYTGGGHTDASYAEPEFREHLLGGMRYAVKKTK